MRAPDPVDTAELERLDTAAREAALDSTRSILLQAPAGSGKTTVLTQRFLRLLATVDEPEQVLAITFTRKAAGEMRERVLRALQAARGAVPEGASAHDLRMRELATVVRQRAQSLGWALEDNPGRLRIQTIDSLNRWLAGHLPVTARATGALAVLERPVALYRLAARRTLLDAESEPQYQQDVEALFERLDNDFGRFERLLTAMLEVRSHWLPRLLRDAEQDLRARVESSLEAIVAERLRNAAAILPAPLLKQGVKLAQLAASLREAAADGSAGAWRVWIEDSCASLGLRHWQGLCALALTQQGTWRLSLTKREGFPTTHKDLKAEALKWIADVSSVPGAQEMMLELSALPNGVLSPEDAEVLESLARLLKLAASELELVFQEAARVDYSYIAAAARRALTEEGTPTDLGLRLGNEIRHILVDEFQDTSIDQYSLIEALTASWEEGDGRTLFVVGDPMQSIYQFREAEVGLFLRARVRGIGQVQLDALMLRRNFRSRPELIAWTNEVFPHIFPARDDPRASAVKYLSSVAGRARGAAGILKLYCTRGVEDEAARIADYVVRTRKCEPQASIAVLVSARTHAAPIVAAFKTAGVPVAGVDLVSLAELPVVRDLAALTRALDHLSDRTAWLAILRAPWCGLTLRDVSLLLDEDASITVWEALHDARRTARLAPEAQQRVQRIRTVLEGALAERERLNLARWVESTWLRLGGPVACADTQDLEHAQAFFATLGQWCTEPDWGGPLTLDERLSQLFATHAGAPQDAVQIMTIHRAKGLEFDKVIVPGLGRKLRADTEPLLRWLELPREPEGSDLLMAPIPRAARRGEEPLTEYLKSLQKRRAAHERTRLLYVAATRARAELHLFAEIGADDEAEDEEGSSHKASPREARVAPRSNTLLAALWPAVAEDFLRAAAAQPPMHFEPQAVQEPTPVRFKRLPAHWQAPAAAPPAPTPEMLSVASYEPDKRRDFPWVSHTERAVGLTVLEQLQRCARLNALPAAANPRSLRERLQRLGLTGEELEHAAQAVLDALGRCAADESLQWMFAASHSDVASPLELTGMYEGRLMSVSIDRAFIDAQGTRWIIQFVPGAPQESASSTATRIEAFLAAELERYRPELDKSLSFAKKLGPHPVQIALYFPMLPVLYKP